MRKVGVVLTVLLLEGCATGPRWSFWKIWKSTDASSQSSTSQQSEAPDSATPPRLLDTEYVDLHGPSTSADSKASNTVMLRFLISGDGTVSDAVVESSSGDAQLDAAALDAVRSRRFDAARRDGKPIASWAMQRFIFAAKPGTDTAAGTAEPEKTPETGSVPANMQPETNPGKASVPSSDDVLRLVHAAHLDQLTHAVIRTSYEKIFNEGKSSHRQLACVRKADDAIFAEPYIAPLQAAFSRDEIGEAIAFLESPAGKKYVALNQIPIYNAIGTPPPNEKPVYSKRDKENIARFSDSPIGIKLFGLNSVFYGDSIKDAMASISLALNKKCEL